MRGGGDDRGRFTEAELLLGWKYVFANDVQSTDMKSTKLLLFRIGFCGLRKVAVSGKMEVGITFRYR